MVRVMLFGLLLVAAAAVVLVIVLRRPPGLTPPPAHASNAEFAEYYRRMADSARRTGDPDSAANYEGMARTYSGLDD